jgi:hypothetical protein
MAELASPRQRVWFRLRANLDRDRALERAAGILMREKPEGTALLSLSLYPRGEGAHAEDPRVETFMWELQFAIDPIEGRDWDWGHSVNEALGAKLRTQLGDGSNV